jgi:hypothetical protein
MRVRHNEGWWNGLIWHGLTANPPTGKPVVQVKVGRRHVGQEPEAKGDHKFHYFSGKDALADRVMHVSKDYNQHNGDQYGDKRPQLPTPPAVHVVQREGGLEKFKIG